MFFLFNIALAIPVLLYFHTNFKILCSSSVENAIDNMTEIALNMQIALGSLVF